MSKTIRLSFNLLLPLLLGSGSFALLFLLTRQFGQNSAVYIGIGTISVLLAALPIAIYRLLLKGQMQQGFAQLNSGQFCLPDEIPLSALLTDAIDIWIPYSQTMQTTACLQGVNERIFVELNLDFTLAADNYGKQIVEHLDEALSQLEQAVQHILYKSSQLDPDMAGSLDGSVLLNEEDEAVLKSKFLSALDMIAIRGVSFPVTTDGIRLNRNVRKEPMAPTLRPGDDNLPDEDELKLNDDLLQSLGMA